jgi:large subunit ribosomal protein L18
VRGRIFGTAGRPRLSVFRSTHNIYGQVINDETGATVASASTLSEAIRAKGPVKLTRAAAREVGKLLGALALEKGVQKVVFDRSGYKFHGRVKELADGAREAGLKF